MPYARKGRKRRRRRRRYKKGSSLGKKLMRDAKTRGTNSLVEKAVKIIAKREAEKLIAPNFIFRRGVWGDYDRDLNRWGLGTPVDMDGLIVHMCQIPLVDDATMPTVIPTADPNLRPTIPNYVRGPNVIAPAVPRDGFRSDSSIEIKSLGAQLRFYLDPLFFVPPAGGPPELTDHEQEAVNIEYRFLAVSEDNMESLGYAPTIDQVLPWHGLGYSSRLDVDIRDTTAVFKSRTLAKGRFRLTYKNYGLQEKYISVFAKCNYRYEYSTLTDGVVDMNGQRVTGPHKIFLALRADTTAASPARHKVHVSGFIKCSYRDS